ncbi:MAG: sortase [Clostridia bacterium]|nr:sortase [Clostridia bacterium]
MNQILVTDKVFITPEFKRKKKAYKFHFVFSVLAVILLSSYCIYGAYERDRDEEVSQMILADLETAEPLEYSAEAETIGNTTMRKEDNIIIVVLDPNERVPVVQEEVKLADFTVDSGIDTTIYTASDGVEYTTIAKIYIPKIDITYPILSQTNPQTVVELMKISPCKFWGADPNEVGNFCIVGHNYKNEKFFSKVPKLEIGDTVDITDTKGRMVTYEVYNKYVVDPTDVECTSQNTNGRKEITLITCTNDSKHRVIVKCKERLVNSL